MAIDGPLAALAEEVRRGAPQTASGANAAIGVHCMRLVRFVKLVMVFVLFCFGAETGPAVAAGAS